MDDESALKKALDGPLLTTKDFSLKMGGILSERPSLDAGLIRTVLAIRELGGCPVLTINANNEGDIDFAKEVVYAPDRPVYVSRVEGFGRPELRVGVQSYFIGKELIREVLGYFMEHGNYEPFLDRLS